MYCTFQRIRYYKRTARTKNPKMDSAEKLCQFEKTDAIRGAFCSCLSASLDGTGYAEPLGGALGIGRLRMASQLCRCYFTLCAARGCVFGAAVQMVGQKGRRRELLELSAWMSALSV